MQLLKKRTALSVAGGRGGTSGKHSATHECMSDSENVPAAGIGFSRFLGLGVQGEGDFQG